MLSPQSPRMGGKRGLIPRPVNLSDSHASSKPSKATSARNLLKPLLPISYPPHSATDAEQGRYREEALSHYRISPPVLVSGTGPMAVTNPNTWLDSARTPGACPPGAVCPRFYMGHDPLRIDGTSDVYVLTVLFFPLNLTSYFQAEPSWEYWR